LIDKIASNEEKPEKERTNIQKLSQDSIKEYIQKNK
jgi:hypothetical protein